MVSPELQKLIDVHGIKRVKEVVNGYLDSLASKDSTCFAWPPGSDACDILKTVFRPDCIGCYT